MGSIFVRRRKDGFETGHGCAPLASPMQYTLGTALPALSRTSIFSLTGTYPRLSTSAPTAARFSPCA